MTEKLPKEVSIAKMIRPGTTFDVVPLPDIFETLEFEQADGPGAVRNEYEWYSYTDFWR